MDRPIIKLLSCGFPHGKVPAAEVVVDCRALPNPHGRPDLRQRTGVYAEVQAYAFGTASAAEMLPSLPSRVLDSYIRDGSAIAFGCHVGPYRSVTIAERLRLQLETDGHDVPLSSIRACPRAEPAGHRLAPATPRRPSRSDLHR